jgi:hypothetical protein
MCLTGRKLCALPSTMGLPDRGRQPGPVLDSFHRPRAWLTATCATLSEPVSASARCALHRPLPALLVLPVIRQLDKQGKIVVRTMPPIRPRPHGSAERSAPSSTIWPPGASGSRPICASIRLPAVRRGQTASWYGVGADRRRPKPFATSPSVPPQGESVSGASPAAVLMRFELPTQQATARLVRRFRYTTGSHVYQGPQEA